MSKIYSNIIGEEMIKWRNDKIIVIYSTMKHKDRN